MTLDDDLIESIGQVVNELKTTRSAFTRNDLREAIDRLNIRRMEEKRRKGYELHPVSKNTGPASEPEANTPKHKTLRNIPLSLTPA